jgi:hypothetical protein
VLIRARRTPHSHKHHGQSAGCGDLSGRTLANIAIVCTQLWDNINRRFACNISPVAWRAGTASLLSFMSAFLLKLTFLLEGQLDRMEGLAA